MKEFVTFGYSYDELSDAAKERVKEWYLNDDSRVYDFEQYIFESLYEKFPNSDLSVEFSLSYCQGDGLNIAGELNLFDFLKIWTATEKENRTIEKYLSIWNNAYTFQSGGRYAYSKKFIDKQYITNYIMDFIGDLKTARFKNIKTAVITKFFYDMLDYFSDLDAEFEKFGYEYLYECSDDEVKEFCDENDYYFTEKGEFLA